MYLKLATPFNPGMNDAGKTYPSLYITQLTDNRSGGNFQFIYEAGSFQTITDLEENTSTVWVKGPGMLSQMATVSGDDYANAIAAKPIVATDTAYQSIYRILYSDLIAQGFAGTIVDS